MDFTDHNQKETTDDRTFNNQILGMKILFERRFRGNGIFNLKRGGGGKFQKERYLATTIYTSPPKNTTQQHRQQQAINKFIVHYLSFKFQLIFNISCKKCRKEDKKYREKSVNQ